MSPAASKTTNNAIGNSPASDPGAPGHIARRLVAHGRVQGVFFRDSVRRAADGAGVSGWVTNRADGAVEAVFEGEPDAVERLVEFCRRGPGRAVVERLEVSEEQPGGEAGFRIV